MTMLKRLFSICSLLVLAACGGGGGDAGTPAFGGGTGGNTPTPAATDLVLVLSSSTIPNSASASVTLTVTALNEQRVAVPNVEVAIAADNGGVVTLPTSTTGRNVTDAQGRLVAAVSIGSVTTLRTISLTATAGAVSRSVPLAVVAAPAGVTPSSIEILATATSVGTGGNPVTIRAFVKDANNNALPNVPISFSTTTGTLASVSSVTDSGGTATAAFSAGSDKSNRTATIKVTSSTASSELRLPIVDTKLTVSGPTSLISGSTGTFRLTATDSSSNPIPGVSIAATSSLANPLATVDGQSTTDLNGQIAFTYRANASGRDNVVFQGAGARVSPLPDVVVSADDFTFVAPDNATTVPVDTDQTVRVRLRRNGILVAGVPVDFASTGGTLSATQALTNTRGEAEISVRSSFAGPVTVQATLQSAPTSASLQLQVLATTPSKLVLQISPTAIPPNRTGSTANNVAQVIARVTDANDNPVSGQTVNFTRVTDPSGGNLLQASATTNESGQATVSYRSGPESTATNGVELRATVASTPSATNTAKLTVNQSALFITLGTGNVIDNLDPQTYRKDWVVYVTDANGIALDGVTLTVKATPIRYLTGQLEFIDEVWQRVFPIFACPNEDLNSNGTLDQGEDTNGDTVLWPGNVIAVTPSSVQTVNGRATVSLVYAENFAPWVEVRLTATATVAGTESKRDAEFIVTGASTDFSNLQIPPAGRVSPFGAPTSAPPGCTAFSR